MMFDEDNEVKKEVMTPAYKIQTVANEHP